MLAGCWAIGGFLIPLPGLRCCNRSPNDGRLLSGALPAAPMQVGANVAAPRFLRWVAPQSFPHLIPAESSHNGRRISYYNFRAIAPPATPHPRSPQRVDAKSRKRDRELTGTFRVAQPERGAAANNDPPLQIISSYNVKVLPPAAGGAL